MEKELEKLSGCAGGVGDPREQGQLWDSLKKPWIQGQSRKSSRAGTSRLRCRGNRQGTQEYRRESCWRDKVCNPNLIGKRGSEHTEHVTKRSMSWNVKYNPEEISKDLKPQTAAAGGPSRSGSQRKARYWMNHLHACKVTQEGVGLQPDVLSQRKVDRNTAWQWCACGVETTGGSQFSLPWCAFIEPYPLTLSPCHRYSALLAYLLPATIYTCVEVRGTF